MPEFLTLLPPDKARELLLSRLPPREPDSESMEVSACLHRILAENILAPHPLPEFPRSTVDGYAVRSHDTFGATDSQPAYVDLVAEIPMGQAPRLRLDQGQCALIHTGGMLPEGADAVVMLEFTQSSSGSEIEVLRAVGEGENVINIGEDVSEGQLVVTKGTFIRPAEIGGLLALGVTVLRVVKPVRIGILATGDEIISPEKSPKPGQVRDVNSFTLSALTEKWGGEAVRYGIISDQFGALKDAAAKALADCDAVVITAGSSTSTRDMTADVIRALGEPGVLVHGINTRPGKPTILGVCNGKAVIGLPGNPVSALVNGYLFVAPVISRLLGETPRPRATVQARLTVNLSSQAGREDWWPVKMRETPIPAEGPGGGGKFLAEPIFGKSNLIFTLANADGLLRIAPDATGLSAGDSVEVLLL